ncbi:MAG: adenylosuccinate synthase [Patescibacteria group bacterium]
MKSRKFLVTGTQWGDEGKGKIIDALLSKQHFDLAARFNGGPNAGNSVVYKGQKFVLHHLPAGIFHPKTLNVIGNGCVIDLLTLEREITEAQALLGYKLKPNHLQISAGAHVIMPWHKTMDKFMEAFFAESTNGSIGTTGRGIGPCYADKDYRHTALRMADFFLPKNQLEEKLQQIAEFYQLHFSALLENQKIKNYFIEPKQPTIFDLDEELKQIPTFGQQLAGAGFIATEFPNFSQYHCLFQGAHGVMLDRDFGTYPFVTSSNTSITGLFSGFARTGEILKDNTVTNIGIVKAYTTRVGRGPFPTKQDNELGQLIREKGHEYGSTTGRPRDCGWLDLVQLKYACEIAGIDCLAITMLDVLSGLPELKICTAYNLGEEQINSWPIIPAQQEKVIPIYTEFNTFSDNFSRPLSSRTSLSPEAQNYLCFIEDYLNIPIILISTGPEAEKTIFRKDNLI